MKISQPAWNNFVAIDFRGIRTAKHINQTLLCCSNNFDGEGFPAYVICFMIWDTIKVVLTLANVQRTQPCEGLAKEEKMINIRQGPFICRPCQCDVSLSGMGGGDEYKKVDRY